MQQKSFWERPEGVTGGIMMGGLLLGGAVLLYNALPYLITLAANSLYLAGMVAALGAIIYMVMDPKMRNLVWYSYQGIMRWITGWFVKIDPISILKSYMENLEDNLKKMSVQIGKLRGQMRQLKGTMDTNLADIEKNIKLASEAKKKDDTGNMTLFSRKAARLQEANAKYDTLYGKMDILYRILTKLYENSEIVLEDTRDQVAVKEQEYKAIKASHSAMESARNVISGDPDKRAMFEQAMEAITNDVSNKVGEMERFMDVSKNLMDSIDLQNGVFEDEGMKILEQFEKQSPLMLDPHVKIGNTSDTLDINTPPKEILKEKAQDNDYFDLFEK